MIQFYYLSVPLQKPEKWDPAVVNYQICIPENNAHEQFNYFVLS